MDRSPHLPPRDEWQAAISEGNVSQIKSRLLQIKRAATDNRSLTRCVEGRTANADASLPAGDDGMRRCARDDSMRRLDTRGGHRGAALLLHLHAALKQRAAL
jgi:hypothetical protein